MPKEIRFGLVFDPEERQALRDLAKVESSTEAAVIRRLVMKAHRNIKMRSRLSDRDLVLLDLLSADD